MILFGYFDNILSKLCRRVYVVMSYFLISLRTVMHNSQLALLIDAIQIQIYRNGRQRTTMTNGFLTTKHDDVYKRAQSYQLASSSVKNSTNMLCVPRPRLEYLQIWQQTNGFKLLFADICIFCYGQRTFDAGIFKYLIKQGMYYFNCYLFPKKSEYNLIISGLYCNGILSWTTWFNTPRVSYT